MRTVIAVVIGLVFAAGVVVGVDYAARLVHPLPEGADPMDPAVVKKQWESAPFGFYVMQLMGWAAGSFFGGFVSAAIARYTPTRAAFITGLVLTAGGGVLTWMLPHPDWFPIAAACVFVPPAMLGAFMGRHRRKQKEDK
jgi:hypothetical protein